MGACILQGEDLMDTLILFGQILATGYLAVAVASSIYLIAVGKSGIIGDYLPTYVFIAASFLVAAYLT